MKIISDFFTISQSTIIDSSTGSLSIMNLVDGVELEKLPEELTGLKLVLKLTVLDSNKNEEAPVSFRLEDPKGKIKTLKSSDEYTISYQPDVDYQKAGLIAEVPFPVSLPGRHVVRVYHEDNEIGFQDFTVFVKDV